MLEQVLFEWYGLSRLEGLLGGQKPKDVGIREFLQGTVLGTFSRTEDNMPHPPAIYSIPEATVTEGTGWTYVDVKPDKSLGIFKGGCADLVRRYQWIINTLFFYHRLSGDEVLASFQLLQGIVGDSAVVESVFSKAPKRTYSVTLFSEEPSLWTYISSGNSIKDSPHQKRLTLLLNASDDLVQRANKVISRYYAFLSRVDTTPVVVPERQGVISYLELLELEVLTPVVLKGKNAVGYDRRLRYQAGEIVQHPVFGLGLVRNASNRSIQVYFPKEGREELLVHRKR